MHKSLSHHPAGIFSPLPHHWDQKGLDIGVLYNKNSSRQNEFLVSFMLASSLNLIAQLGNTEK